MKVCFLLQRRFVYVGHAMAMSFQKKYGIKEFCGYVYVRSGFDFLKKQKDVNYTKLLLDEDLHKGYKKEKIDLNFLKKIEREYGIPNLWSYIEVDRIVRHNMLVREYPYNTPKYSYEEMMKILQIKAMAIIKFLDEEKPDLVIISAIGAIGSMLLYQIAKKRNIKTFTIEPSRIGIKYSIGEDYGEPKFVKKTFKEIQDNPDGFQNYIRQAEEFLKEFRNKPTVQNAIDSLNARPVTRYRQLKFLLPHLIFQSFVWLLKTIYNYFVDENRGDYSNVKPWHYLWDKTKRKMRILIGFSDLYDRIDLNENYAFFPLQLEPEIASLLYAPFYTDQLWLAKQIGRSLPIDYKLYIKEHPAMFGYRPRKYYKELKKIPNVKLIEPTTISFSLEQNAKLILTTTGSAGWEGIMLKKPAITFGKVFYNELPMTKNCKAIEDLPYLVKEQTENFQYDEKTLINMLAAIYKESADVDLIQLWDIEGDSRIEKKEKELISLVDFIAEKIGLKSQPAPIQ